MSVLKISNEFLIVISKSKWIFSSENPIGKLFAYCNEINPV